MDEKVNIIATLINHFKSPRYLLVISIISGVLLFAPNYFIIQIGLNSFVSNSRMWIGLAFLISTGFWIVDMILTLYKYIKRKSIYNDKRKEAVRRLQNLTPEEKSILINYYVSKSRTQVLDYTNGVVRELEYYDIIYRASNLSKIGTRFAYNIQPWAWDYIHKNQEVLS